MSRSTSVVEHRSAPDARFAAAGGSADRSVDRIADAKVVGEVEAGSESVGSASAVVHTPNE